MKEDNQNRSGEYEKSYGGSSYNKDERSHFTSRKEDTKSSDVPRREVPPTQQTPSIPSTQGKKRRSLNKNPFLIWLLIVLMSTAFTWIMNDESFDLDEQTEETLDDPWSSDEEEFEEDLEDLEEDPEPVRDEANDEANDASNDVSLPSESESDSSAIAPMEKDEKDSDDGLPTLDALERSTHAEVVKEAKRVGVSTEGSTLDIMERINRKEMENIKW